MKRFQSVITCFCYLFAGGLLSVTCNAQQVTIDFQSLEHMDAGNPNIGNKYCEDGFQLTTTSNVFITFGTLHPQYSGSTALVCNAGNWVTTLTREGGGAFELESINLCELNGPQQANVTFTGQLAGGGTTSQTFTIDGIAFEQETFNFDESFQWVNSVSWVQGFPYHQFDDIVVSVYPGLDQSQFIANLGTGSVGQNSPGFGQSFTAGTTGLLTIIDVESNGGHDGGELTLEIRSGDGTTGTILGSKSFVLDPNTYDVSFGPGGTWRQPLDISDLGIGVEAGQQYTFLFADGSGEIADRGFLMLAGDEAGDAYTGGSLKSPVFGDFGTPDMVFATFVDPDGMTNNAGLVSSFDSGLFAISIGYESDFGLIYVYESSGSTLELFDEAGTLLDSIPFAGISVDSADLFFAGVPTNIGGIDVPDNALLVINSGISPTRLLAANPITGSIIASQELDFSTALVGGTYCDSTGTFFTVDWATDEIYEFDGSDGNLINTFPVGSGFDVFYGDIEYNPIDDNLYLVSDSQNLIRVFDPSGGLVRDVITPSAVSGMSGIAFNRNSGNAWVSSINGGVYQLSVPVENEVLLGDVNGDGSVNLLDVQPFVDLISSGGFQVEADINEDGVVNLLDVAPFVGILSGN